MPRPTSARRAQYRRPTNEPTERGRARPPGRPLAPRLDGLRPRPPKQAAGKELAPAGPRGGGRSVAKMRIHVHEADGGYLQRARRPRRNGAEQPARCVTPSSRRPAPGHAASCRTPVRAAASAGRPRSPSGGQRGTRSIMPGRSRTERRVSRPPASTDSQTMCQTSRPPTARPMAATSKLSQRSRSQTQFALALAVAQLDPHQRQQRQQRNRQGARTSSRSTKRG